MLSTHLLIPKIWIFVIFLFHLEPNTNKRLFDALIKFVLSAFRDHAKIF